MMIKKITLAALLFTLLTGLLPQTTFGWSSLFQPDPYRQLPDSVILTGWRFPHIGADLYDPSLITSRSKIFPPVAPSAERPDTSSLLRKKMTAKFDTSDVTCGIDDLGYSSCSLSVDPQPTEQNIEIIPYTIPAGETFIPFKGFVPVPASTRYYAKQTFTHPNAAQLSEAQQNVQVTYVSPTEVTLTAPSSATQETYATIYERYADVVAIRPGNKTNSIPLELCFSYDEIGSLDCPVAVYKNEKTYFMRWITGFTWTKDELTSERYSYGEGGSSIAYPPILPVTVVQNNKSPIGRKTSFVVATSSPTFVTLPLNDAILHITKPRCVSGVDRGAFKTTVWVLCITYGLSADGRAGTGTYYKSDSKFGGYLTPVLFPGFEISLSLIASLDLVIPGAGTTLVASLVDEALADPVLQGAVLNSNSNTMTVRASNSLGVGIWKWSGGFSHLPPSVSVRANNMHPTLNVTVPDNNTTITWSSSYVMPKSCVASGNWSGVKGDSGTLALGMLPRGTANPGSGQTYDYTLTCDAYDPNAPKATDNVKVTVWQYPVCTFKATPTSIDAGDSSRLTWSCKYASSCSIDNGIGSVNRTFGAKVVSPGTTTTYALSCNGIDGARTFQTTVSLGDEIKPPSSASPTTTTSTLRIREELPGR